MTIGDGGNGFAGTTGRVTVVNVGRERIDGRVEVTRGDVGMGAAYTGRLCADVGGFLVYVGTLISTRLRFAGGIFLAGGRSGAIKCLTLCAVARGGGISEFLSA